jgi:hypothetical protein
MIVNYKYKYNKYLNKINMMKGGSNYGNIYMLVSSEFKYIENDIKIKNINDDIDKKLLGKLGEYSSVVGKLLLSNDNFLLNEIKKIPQISIINNNIPVINKTMTPIEKQNIGLQIKSIKKIEKQQSIDLQKNLEAETIHKTNIRSLYNDEYMYGSDFIAIVLNHHFIRDPYLHIAYTILKYDIINKKIYLDLFVSTTQHINQNLQRHREFVPKMFDEKNYIEYKNYSQLIFSFIKSDIHNINLLKSKINMLDVKLDQKFDTEPLILKIQKNVIQYLSGENIINDVQQQQQLCNHDKMDLRNVIYAEKYKSIIGRIKEIIINKKIMDNKNYTIIATSENLLKNDILIEKHGEEDKHAEALLMRYYKNTEFMDGFKSDDLIYVVRIYKNMKIGCGLLCGRCVNVLNFNGIKNAIYSINDNEYNIININDDTYTYTTMGNKIFNIDHYLYDDYKINKELMNDDDILNLSN